MSFTGTEALWKISKLKNRTRIIKGGTSAGKTIAILICLINKAMRHPIREISVVTDTIPALRRGALKDFISIMKSMALFEEKQFNRSILKYDFLNGSYIEFFSTDQPEKLRGSRRTDLFINEANRVSFSAYQEMSIRTSKTVTLDYNPSALFWVDRELVGQPDTDFITLTYKDNNALSPSIVKELEKAREKGKTSKFWSNWCRVYLDGLTGSLEGSVFKDIHYVDNIPEDARLLAHGMDFGYSIDPTSIVSLYKYNDTFIFDELLYKTGMLNRDIYNYINTNNVEGDFYADSAEPKSIAEIRLSGVDIFPVTKGRDSIVYGINLINQNKVFVTNRSKNLKKEIEGYVWTKDKDGNTLQKPNGISGDHAIDAARYAIMMVLENPNRGTYYLY